MTKPMSELIADAVAKAMVSKDAEIAALKARKGGASRSIFKPHVENGTIRLYESRPYGRQVSLYREELGLLKEHFAALTELARSAGPKVAENSGDWSARREAQGWLERKKKIA